MHFNSGPSLLEWALLPDCCALKLKTKNVSRLLFTNHSFSCIFCCEIHLWWVWRKWLAVLSQLSAQEACGSIHTCVLRRMEAGSLGSRRTGLGGPGGVTTQVWSPPSKARGMECLLVQNFFYCVNVGETNSSKGMKCSNTSFIKNSAGLVWKFCFQHDSQK